MDLFFVLQDGGEARAFCWATKGGSFSPWLAAVLLSTVSQGAAVLECHPILAPPVLSARRQTWPHPNASKPIRRVACEMLKSMSAGAQAGLRFGRRDEREESRKQGDFRRFLHDVHGRRGC